MFDKLEAEYWLQYAIADLESAEIILNSTENFHISIYHSHQSVEKMLKRYCILIKREFPYIHDLLSLYDKISDVFSLDELQIKELMFLMKAYSNTRYPKGDKITDSDARTGLDIAKKFFELLKLKHDGDNR